jgi:nucleotide-binding universal stress UspA family protein
MSQTIIAATDESGRFQPVIDAALERAGEGGTVILYDVDAAGSGFTSPRPNVWAGEGERHEYDGPLDPIALEKLGRHEFALQVEKARLQGGEVFGWLPDKSGGAALLAYAAQQQATLIVLPDSDDVRDLVTEVQENSGSTQVEVVPA